MPYKPPKIEKIFFSIGEVAEMFDLNTSTIRYWEKEFDIIQPKKNKKGNRIFTREDVQNFHVIYNLVKEKGMTLKGAKLKLDGHKTSAVNNSEVIRRLKEIRETLANMSNEISESNEG